MTSPPHQTTTNLIIIRAHSISTFLHAPPTIEFFFSFSLLLVLGDLLWGKTPVGPAGPGSRVLRKWCACVCVKLEISSVIFFFSACLLA